MYPDPDIPAGPAGERRLKKIALKECRLLWALFKMAVVQENGVFQLSHLPLTPGTSERWPYRMCNERDCSHIAQRIAESIGTITESVIDSASYELRDGDGQTTAFHRTVAGHVRTAARYHLMAAGHREERSWEDASSLPAQVLRELIDGAHTHRIDLSSAPLIGLEPELSDSSERRLLYAEDIPYALLLDKSDTFKKVLLPLDDSWDIREPRAIMRLFEIYEPPAENGRLRCLPIEDLSERGPGRGGRKVQEFFFEVPVAGETHYFVTWPALEGACDDERRDAAEAIAVRAGRRMLAPPGRELRMHEFHHPHPESYVQILRNVDYGRP